MWRERGRSGGEERRRRKGVDKCRHITLHVKCVHASVDCTLTRLAHHHCCCSNGRHNSHSLPEVDGYMDVGIGVRVRCDLVGKDVISVENVAECLSLSVDAMKTTVVDIDYSQLISGNATHGTKLFLQITNTPSFRHFELVLEGRKGGEGRERGGKREEGERGEVVHCLSLTSMLV